MAEEYSKYKLYRKYKTEDGVNYTPLDEYQALYKSGDGVDCSCGYRETEWIGTSIYECGSIKEYEINEEQTIWFDSANTEGEPTKGESVTVVEIEIPKGYYDKPVKLFYNHSECCDGGIETITIVNSGTYIPNDSLYVLRYDNDNAVIGYCYGLEVFRLYIDGIESGTTYDKTFKMKLYNGRTNEILKEKVFCPTDSSYDEITDNVKRGDIVDIGYDCGYGGYKLDFDNPTETICGDEIHPKLEITRIEGDWNYTYDSDNGIYTITSNIIEIEGETNVKVYFKLNKPSDINISSTSNGRSSWYGTKLSDIDSDISNVSSATTFDKTFTVLDTNEHYFEAYLNKRAPTSTITEMVITLKLSTSYDYTEKLYKYNVIKYDLTDSTNNEVLNYYIPLKKVKKLSEIDNETTFKTIYFDKNMAKKLVGSPYYYNFNSSQDGSGGYSMTFRYYSNTDDLSICENYCYMVNSIMGYDISTYTTRFPTSFYKIGGSISMGSEEYLESNNKIFEDNVYVQIETDKCPCGYDSIEYIPSDDDEIIDGKASFYYLQKYPYHTYKKVQGYKVCDGNVIGEHIGDYQYQIYEENKYLDDYTLTITGSGKCSRSSITITPNKYIRGETYNGSQHTLSFNTSLDNVDSKSIFGLNDYAHTLYSLNGFFQKNAPLSSNIYWSYGVKGIKLPSLENCIDMSSAFSGMYYLETLDASNAKIKPEQIGEYCSGVFSGCDNLTSLILGDVTQEQYDWWYARLVDEGIQDNVTITYNIV